MIDTVILIVGLPGSGKAKLGNELIETIEDSIFFDDVIDDAEMEPIRMACNNYKTVIMTSPYLCVEKARERAVAFFKGINKKVKIQWKYFDYDVRTCILNKPDWRNRIFSIAEHYIMPKRVKKLKVELYDKD
jgi:hypothetical protein